MNLSNVLKNLPPGVKIKQKSGGNIELIIQKYSSKEEILNTKYAHLLGQNITLSSAAKKYNIPRSTISNWIYNANYIAPIDPDAYPIYLPESEVSYLSDLYKERKKTNSKAPLVDENGLPYQLKRPDVAEYRRKKKTGPLNENKH